MRPDEPTPLLDTARFEALYVELEKPVFNVVYRWVWNRDEARELTQEAFMKLWERRATVRLETAKSLVFQAALNLAANRLRARKVRQFFGVRAHASHLEMGGDPSLALEADQTRAQVRAAVEALPEKLKAVVMLCEFSGLPTADIAKTLGIPLGTVGSRRSAAMAALEKALGPLHTEPLDATA